MKKSTQILALHCLLLFLMVTLSISSPLIRYLNPLFFFQVFFPSYATAVVLTVIGWSPCLGGCALTKLENHYRRLENNHPYEDTFIVHYIARWTGVQVPGRVITYTLVGLMLLPVLVRYYE